MNYSYQWIRIAAVGPVGYQCTRIAVGISESFAISSNRAFRDGLWVLQVSLLKPDGAKKHPRRTHSSREMIDRFVRSNHFSVIEIRGANGEIFRFRGVATRENDSRLLRAAALRLVFAMQLSRDPKSSLGSSGGKPFGRA